MSSTQPLPPKKEVALALLERSSVYVHLDPRQPAVAVPPWFKKQAQLVLQIGLNMPVPIPDLRLDEQGMSCTLSFNRSPFFCVVPWSSVFAMVGEDGRGMVWPDDVPAEVARQAQVRAVDAEAKREAKPAVEAVKEAKPESAKPKRVRTKRASLAAVPDEEVARPKKAPKPVLTRGERIVEKEKPAPRPVAAPAPAPAPAVTPRPAAGPARKKRELPPYLRVVK
jgi:stringent starvation protein B